jgi:hypothetical protein
MPHWIVKTREVYECSYDVEASSQEEAISRVYGGCVYQSEQTFDDFLKDETTAEEVTE